LLSSSVLNVFGDSAKSNLTFAYSFNDGRSSVPLCAFAIASSAGDLFLFPDPPLLSVNSLSVLVLSNSPGGRIGTSSKAECDEFELLSVEEPDLVGESELVLFSVSITIVFTVFSRPFGLLSPDIRGGILRFPVDLRFKRLLSSFGIGEMKRSDSIEADESSGKIPESCASPATR